MKEIYMLVTNPANNAAANGESPLDDNLSLFRLEDDAVREFHPVESTSIDREYGPLQLYSCDKALIPDPGSRMVFFSSRKGNKGGEPDPEVYTLMLVSHTSPRQSVVLVSAQFDREEFRGGAGMFIAPFLEILRKEPVDSLASHARRLLRERSETNVLRNADGSSMTFDDMMDLLL